MKTFIPDLRVTLQVVYIHVFYRNVVLYVQFVLNKVIDLNLFHLCKLALSVNTIITHFGFTFCANGRRKTLFLLLGSRFGNFVVTEKEICRSENFLIPVRSNPFEFRKIF